MPDNTPNQNEPPPESPTDAPGVVIITLNGNINPVTGDCTENFTASLADSSEPTLALSFFEAKPSPTAPNGWVYLPITVSPTPTVTWNSGVASFALPMDSAIFDQLSSLQAWFQVKAQNTADSDNFGITTIAISLSAP